MNAKPLQKSVVNEEKYSRQEGMSQDVFVDDDPALKAWAAKARVENKVNPSGDGGLKSEKLHYIHEMLLELRKLSLTIDEPMVAYLIEMAVVETDTALNVGQFRDEFSNKIESGL
ncbi:MAG: hypothetical protein WBC71_10795 [Salaquimonas sp.]